MTQILVAGAGALGSFFTSAFHEHAMPVTLLARGQRLVHLRQAGLSIFRHNALRRFAPDVRANCKGLKPADLVILACKYPDLPGVLDTIRPAVGPETAILTVQNGVEAPDMVANAFPQATVIASRVHGFFEMQDGIVHHIGVDPSVTFGPTHGNNPAVEQKFAALLARLHIEHVRSSDIRSELWAKLLLAAPLGGVGAALAIPAGEILAGETSATMLRTAMHEVATVAAAKGISLPPDCVDQTLAFVATFPVDATTSMQRDLEAGLPSEYDYIVGTVLRMAGETGIPVPTFRQIDTAIAARRNTAD